MAVQKPNIPNNIWANKSYEYSSTDPEYHEIIQKPSQEKVNKGWELGEKPSHKYFNYLWQRNTAILKILNTFGVLPWDPETFYYQNSFVIFNGILYIALLDNNNELPSNSTSWEIYNIKLNDLSDVNIDLNQNDTYWNCSDTILCTDTGYCSQFSLRYNSTNQQWEAVLGSELEIPISKLIPLNKIKNTEENYILFRNEDKQWEAKNFNSLNFNNIINEDTINKENPKNSKNTKNSKLLTSNFEYEDLIIEWDNILYKPKKINPNKYGVKIYNIDDVLYIKKQNKNYNYQSFKKELDDFIIFIDSDKEIYTDQKIELSYYFNNTLLKKVINSFYISKKDPFLKHLKSINDLIVRKDIYE